MEGLGRGYRALSDGKNTGPIGLNPTELGGFENPEGGDDFGFYRQECGFSMFAPRCRSVEDFGSESFFLRPPVFALQPSLGFDLHNLRVFRVILSSHRF